MSGDGSGIRRNFALPGACAVWRLPGVDAGRAQPETNSYSHIQAQAIVAELVRVVGGRVGTCGSGLW